MAATSGVSAADMGTSTAVGTGNLPPSSYTPPPQAQMPYSVKYALPANQYTPYISNSLGAPNTQRNAVSNYWNELIPTSINDRNAALQQTLSQLSTPMQGLFLSQQQDSAAQNYGASAGALQSAMANRGLINSGPSNMAMRSNSANYLQNLAVGQQTAQAQNQSRTSQLLSQVLGTAQSDVNFYGALRSGSLAAQNTFGPYNYGWPQTAAGIVQLAKTIASLGAGAAGAGGGDVSGGSGLPSGMDYGSTATAGDYGMSFGGVGGAAGDYGMSSGGFAGGVTGMPYGDASAAGGASGGGMGFSGGLQAYLGGGAGGLAAYMGGY